MSRRRLSVFGINSMGFEAHVQNHSQPALFETLHGRLPQGVAIFDGDLRLVYGNARWSTFLEHANTRARECAPGAHFIDLLPAATDLQAAALRCVRDGETVHLQGRPCDAHTGEMFWDITLAPLVDHEVITGLICVVDDATARILAERAASAKARLAAFRADVSQALASSDDVDIVLQACAEAMVRHAPAAFARIWVLDEVEDSYRLRASAGLYTRLNGTYARIPADWIRQKTFAGYEPGMGLDILRTHHVREPEWAAEQGLVAWANHPLIVRGHIIGFMVMFARQNFDDDTLGELAAVADAIAQFLERKHAESALRERETLFRGVFESAADGLVISDLETGRVLEANPAICAMHGYSCDEFTALSRDDLVHPDSYERLRDYVMTIKGGRASRVKLLHVRKDGSIFTVTAQGSPILYQGRPSVLSIVRDVTQEQEAQERLEQRVAERTQELSLLLEIARNVAATLDLEPLLGLILDELRAAVDYHGAGVLVLQDDVLVQTASAARGPNPEHLAKGIRLPLTNASLIRRILERGEPLVIGDVWDDSEAARDYRQIMSETWLQTRPYIRSWVGVPLQIRNRTLGLLVVTYGEANHFTDQHVRVLAAVAAQASVAIENAQLVSAVRESSAVDERQRLARDLHDAVTQTLFSASLVGDVLPTLWARDQQRGAEALEDLRMLTRGALAEMRTLLFELRPAALIETPLGDLLRHLADAVTGRTRLPVTVTVQNGETLPPDVQIAFYRIAQEALNNVVKHAQASQVELQVTAPSDRAIRLRVHDNGRGFNPSDTPAGHFGMQTMRERAAAIGALLTVTSAADHGTDVVVTWPGESHMTEFITATEET